MVEFLAGWAAIALRIIFAAIFIPNGYAKLTKNFQKTVEFVESIGFRPSKFWALSLGLGELLGGILVFIGLFTRIGVGLLAIVMLVATYFQIFVWKKTFKEYQFDLLLIASLITLFLLGAGNLSFDILIGGILG